MYVIRYGGRTGGRRRNCPGRNKRRPRSDSGALGDTSKPSAPILPLPDGTKPPEEAWTTVTATAYCPCEKCCGAWAKNRPNGIVYTASGAIAQEGVTIAADWDVYPLGTVLQVEGLGEYIVQDRGGAIKGLKIDVYFEDHDDALQFGRQEVRIRVVKAVTE